MLRILLSRYYPLYLHLYCKSFVSVPCIWSCGSLLSTSQATEGQAFIAYNYNDVFWQLSLFSLRVLSCLRRTLHIKHVRSLLTRFIWEKSISIRLCFMSPCLKYLIDCYLFLFFRCSLLEFSGSLPLLVLQRDRDLEKRKATSQDEFIY